MWGRRKILLETNQLRFGGAIFSFLCVLGFCIFLALFLAVLHLLDVFRSATRYEPYLFVCRALSAKRLANEQQKQTISEWNTLNDIQSCS